MSVYPKGRFWHYDFIIKGRRYFGSTGQETRRNAEAVERARRLEAATGIGEDAGDMTLDLAASRYFDEVNATLDEDTDLLRRLRVVLDCVGKGKLLKEIDTAAISEAIKKRRGMQKRSLAPATINRDIIDHTLRPLLNRARKVWGARTLPAIDWRSVRLKEPKGIVREYSTKEIEAWRNELEPVPRLALDLMLTYGLRFGELFFLPSHVDGVGLRLTLVNRKAGDSLTLPLQPGHARTLAAMASTRKAAEPRHEFSDVQNLPDGVTMDELIRHATNHHLDAMQKSYPNHYLSEKLADEEMAKRTTRQNEIRQRQLAAPAPS